MKDLTGYTNVDILGPSAFPSDGTQFSMVLTGADKPDIEVAVSGCAEWGEQDIVDILSMALDAARMMRQPLNMPR
jgi:hypothetical protein